MINVPLRRLHKNDLTCFEVIAMTLSLITCQGSISAYYPRIVDCENDIVLFEWPSSKRAKPFDIRGMYDHTIHHAKEIYHTGVPSGGGERKLTAWSVMFRAGSVPVRVAGHGTVSGKYPSHCSRAADPR
jgi:hypothetical protein